MDERPLWVQLYWGKDQREGRFVLQNAKLPKVRIDKKKLFFLLINFSFLKVSKPIGGSFKERRSSKRESKKKKKQDKVSQYSIFEIKKFICMKSRMSLFT
jgi:hypothetical protein